MPLHAPLANLVDPVSPHAAFRGGDPLSGTTTDSFDGARSVADPLAAELQVVDPRAANPLAGDRIDYENWLLPVEPASLGERAIRAGSTIAGVAVFAAALAGVLAWII